MTKIGLFSNKSLSLYLYGVFFLYQMFGVMIHKMYGFGFFWWPIQMYAMLIISLISISNLYNLKKIKGIVLSLDVFNLYVLAMLVMQIIYLFNPMFYSAYMEEIELMEILTDTILWYLIVLVMAVHFEDILRAMSLRYITMLYLLILFFFFMYVIKLNGIFGGGIERAFWIGANFPTQELEMFLSGYVRGFHLYFSPLFAIYSIVFIVYLQKVKKYDLSYIVFFISTYILFLASGRGTLLVFVLTFTIFFTQRRVFVYMAILLLIVSVVGLPVLDMLEEKNQRLYNLLTFSLDEDNSSAGRSNLLYINLQYIQSNWLTGGIRAFYATEARVYIHSFLNILQEYGIVIFTFLVLFFLRGIYFLVSKRDESDTLLIAKAIFFYMLIEMLLFKHVHEVNSLIPMVIAYSYLSRHKIQPKIDS